MSPARACALFAPVCLLLSTTWLVIRIGLQDLPPIGAACIVGGVWLASRVPMPIPAPTLGGR